METTSQHAQPLAELLLPPVKLASIIYGGFVRDTRGCELRLADRFNHFAAAPLCTITWFFEGECIRVEPGTNSLTSGGIPVPKIAFSGPQTGPASSWSEGDIHAMMVSFYPDAFQRLTGINVAGFVGETLPAGEVLPQWLMDTCQQVADLKDSNAGFDHLMQVIGKRHNEQQTGPGQFLASISGWSTSVAVAAYRSGAGRSLRQVERRVRAWTGMTRRDLEHHARLETTFALAAEAARSGELDPAEVAYQAGFSDQSHMGRNVKRHTGHSPLQLMQRIETDEAYWCYRLVAGMNTHQG